MKRYAFILMFLFVGAGLLGAQQPQVLTLDESIQIAMENNPQFQMAEKNVAKARAGVTEAYSTILPSVNASANLQHSWEIQTSRIPNFIKPMLPPELLGMLGAGTEMPDYVEISFGLENMLTYGVNLQQPLYLGGAGWAGIKMARAGARAAELDLEAQRQNLIYQTTRAFYGVILAKELVKVQEEALRQAEANLDVVTQKYDAGSASRFDKMRAEVNVANLKPAAISARNSYQTALTGLTNILGLSKEERVQVDGALFFVEDAMFDSLTLEAMQKKALQNRPEVQALSEQLYITQKGITAARSALLPKVFFQTDYSYMANFNDEEWESLGQNDFSKGFTSTMSLQVPLFSGLKNSKQVQKAKLDYRIMEDTQKQVRDGINAEVEVAYNSFQEAKEKFDAASESVTLAEESYDLSTIMYEEGAGTQLDVWSAQLALTQSRMNYLSSLYEYQMARYELRKVTGTLKGTLS